MSDEENVFIVVMKSSALGAGAAERAHDQQTRTLLRALDMNAGDVRVFRRVNPLRSDTRARWEHVVYDSYGDDMGHRPGHDEPLTAHPVEVWQQGADLRWTP